MIYVSSSSVRNNKISDSIEELTSNGFFNIELSGGTNLYENIERDLLDLQQKYGLNYLCHNYFPPPIDHFVLNLASLNDDVFTKSFSHIEESIRLSKILGAPNFAFHAGFFIHVEPKEIGKKISKSLLFDKTKSIQRFIDSYQKLQDYAGDLKLYIENNVYSSSNFTSFSGEDIFMLTNLEDYDELKSKVDFNFLLDVAHLKVSCKTLDLDFLPQLNNLYNLTDYIHVSDNDNLHDNNDPISLESEFIDTFKNETNNKKTYTLEVYSSIDKIRESYDLLEKTIGSTD
jgi:sugar phosphate isomerase/epimerase